MSGSEPPQWIAQVRSLYVSGVSNLGPVAHQNVQRKKNTEARILLTRKWNICIYIYKKKTLRNPKKTKQFNSKLKNLQLENILWQKRKRV